MALTTSYVEQALRRMVQSGDLDVIRALLRGAAAMVEDELLKKLATFPVADGSDLSAFAYRQGWLRGLRQVEAIIDPDRVRRAMEAGDDFVRTAFSDEQL